MYLSGVDNYADDYDESDHMKSDDSYKSISEYRSYHDDHGGYDDHHDGYYKPKKKRVYVPVFVPEKEKKKSIIFTSFSPLFLFVRLFRL